MDECVCPWRTLRRDGGERDDGQGPKRIVGMMAFMMCCFGSIRLTKGK